MLRSRLKEEDNELWWSEFDSEDDISIPFVDLSEYDFFAGKLFSDIVARKFFTKDFDLYHTLPFRILLVKFNLKDWLLLLPFSHLAFDGLSGDIIKRQDIRIL